METNIDVVHEIGMNTAYSSPLHRIGEQPSTGTPGPITKNTNTFSIIYSFNPFSISSQASQDQHYECDHFSEAPRPPGRPHPRSRCPPPRRQQDSCFQLFPTG